MMLRCFFSMPPQVGFLTAAKPDSGMCQAARLYSDRWLGQTVQQRSQRFFSGFRFIVASVLFQGLLDGRWLFLPISFWHIDKTGIIALDYLFSLLSVICSSGNRPVFRTVRNYGNPGLPAAHGVADPLCLCIKGTDPVIQRFLLFWLRMRCSK